MITATDLKNHVDSFIKKNFNTTSEPDYEYNLNDFKHLESIDHLFPFVVSFNVSNDSFVHHQQILNDGVISLTFKDEFDTPEYNLVYTIDKANTSEKVMEGKEKEDYCTCGVWPPTEWEKSAHTDYCPLKNMSNSEIRERIRRHRNDRSVPNPSVAKEETLKDVMERFNVDKIIATLTEEEEVDADEKSDNQEDIDATNKRKKEIVAQTKSDSSDLGEDVYNKEPYRVYKLITPTQVMSSVSDLDKLKGDLLSPGVAERYLKIEGYILLVLKKGEKFGLYFPQRQELFDVNDKPVSDADLLTILKGL